LTYLKSNTNLSVMGLAALGNVIWDGVKTGAGHLANGLGTVVDYGADALAHIPVVGETLSTGLGSIGDFGVEALQGNFSTALGDLYGGVDTLVGGVLPGGQNFAQGYLGQLYQGADKMVGGYLPNINGGAANSINGGVGYTPTYMKAQKAFDALPGPGGAASTYGGGGGMSGVAITGNEAKAPMTFWDKAEVAANVGAAGMGIYGMLQDSPEAANANARANATRPQPMLINPGVSNAGMNALSAPAVVRNDPAMAGSPEARSTTGQTGGAVKTGELTEMSDDELGKNLVEQLNNTQSTISNVTGQTAPVTPTARVAQAPVQTTQLQMYMPTALGPTSGYTSNIPGGPRAEYVRPVSTGGGDYTPHTYSKNYKPGMSPGRVPR
jgi:hypothetical protein